MFNYFFDERICHECNAKIGRFKRKAWIRINCRRFFFHLKCREELPSCYDPTHPHLKLEAKAMLSGPLLIWDADADVAAEIANDEKFDKNEKTEFVD